MANVIDMLDELQNRLVHFAESVRSWDMKFMRWILFAQERNFMLL